MQTISMNPAPPPATKFFQKGIGAAAGALASGIFPCFPALTVSTIRALSSAFRGGSSKMVCIFNKRVTFAFATEVVCVDKNVIHLYAIYLTSSQQLCAALRMLLSGRVGFVQPYVRKWRRCSTFLTTREQPSHLSLRTRHPQQEPS